MNYNNGNFGASGNNTGDTDVFGVLNGTAGVINVGSVSAGTLIFNAAGSGNYTLSSGTITLGASGVVTVNSNATIGSTLAGASTGLLVNGGGILTLTGSNSYTGTTTVTLSTLTLNTATGSLKNTTPLTLNGGTLHVDNVGASAAYSGTFGALTFSAGDGTVRTTRTAAQDEALKFSSLTARSAGATGNFVNGGGTNGTTNGFVLTGVTANSFIDSGIFYGGSSYAWYDAGGFVRAINYATDANAATNSGGTALSGSAYQQITGAITGQTTATITNLNISGNNNFALTSGSLTVNGILKSGNTAGGATISGGSSIEAANNAELVIRTDGANDALTISTPILANGANALTKSGAGTLTLSGNNTYTGVTYLDGGILNLGNANALGGGGNITFNGGTLQYSASNQADYSGRIVNSTGAISIDTNSQSVTFNTVLAATNTGGLTKNGSGLLVLGTSSNYTGPTTVVSGTLRTAVGGGLPGGNNAGSALIVYSGATVDFNNTSSWIGALSGSGSLINGSASNGILIGGNGWTSTWAGNIINSRIWFWGAGVTLNMSGSSSLTANTGFAGQGNPYYQPDTINLSGTINMVATSLPIGQQGSVNFNVNGGYLQVPGSGPNGIFLSSYNGNSGVAVNNSNLTLNSGSISAPILEENLTASSNNTGASSTLAASTGTANIFVNGGVLSVGMIKNISTLAAPMTLTINGGTVQVAGNSGNYGNGNLFGDNGYNNELTVQIGANGATIDTNGFATASQRPLMNVTGSSSAGALTVIGSGALNLSGTTGSFTGRTQVNSGATVRISNDLNLGVAPGSPVANQVELNGGTLNFSPSLSGLSLPAFTSGSSATITTLTATGVTAAAMKVDNSILSLTGGTGGSVIVGTVSVVIAPPDMPGGVQATASVIVSSGSITGYQIINPGSGYSVAPAIYLTATNGKLPGSNPTVGYYGFTGNAPVIESEGIVTGPVTLTLNNLGTSTATVTATTTTSLTLAANRGIQLDAGGGTLDVSNGAVGLVATVNAPITGAGMLTKTGSGVLILTNTTNSWAGGTRINGGILDLPNANVVPNYATTMGVNAGGILGLAFGGPSDWTSAQIATLLSGTMFAAGSGLGLDTTNLSGTYANNITNPISFAKLGANTLTLTGNNSYTGTTFIDGGILALGSTNALGTTGTITFNGGLLQGTLQYSGSNATDYSALIKNSLGAISIDTNSQNVTFGSALGSSNTGGLTKNGLGQLTLSVANTYTGTNTINGGTLQIGNATALGNAGNALVINTSGTLDLNAKTSVNVGPLTGSGTITNTTGTASLYVSPLASSTDTFAGSILQTSGSIGRIDLFTRNNGTLVLAGTSSISNLYGSTGALIITGSVAVSGGVTAGNDSSTGPITVNGGYLNDAGTLIVGNNGNTGQFTLTSGTTYVKVYVDSAGSGVGSTLNLNGGVLISDWVANFNNASSPLTMNFNGGTLRSNGIHGNGGQLMAFIGNGYYGGAELAVTTGTGGAFLDTNGYTEYSVRPFMNTSGQVGGVTKLGAGTLSMSNTNSYTGATTVNAGTLIFDYSLWASSTNATPESILASGTTVNIAGGATFEVKGRPNASGTTLSTVSTFTSGQALLIQMASSTGMSVGESVSGTNIAAGTYISQIYSNGNVILSAKPTSASSGSATVTFASATFNAITQSIGSINLTSGTGIVDVEKNSGSGMTLAVTNGVTGVGALQKNGDGVLALNGSGNYTGGTIVNGGTLQMLNPYALGSTSGTLTMTSGTLDLYGNNLTAASLTGNGGVITTSTTGNLALTISGSTTGTFGAAINDGAGHITLTEAGSGVQALTGSNNYSGGTVISSGTLQVGNTYALGGSANALTINGGALDLHGSTINVGTLSGTGGSIFNLGNIGAATLTVNNGALVTSTYGGSIVQTTGTLISLALNSGTLALTGSSTLNNLTANGGSLVLAGNLSSSSGNWTATGGGNIVVTGSVSLPAGLIENGTVTVNGGYLNAGAYGSGLVTGVGNGAAGTLIVNSGTVSTGIYVSHFNGGAGSAINLNGGVFLASWIGNFSTGSGGDLTLNFNGGTLRANGVPGNSGQAAELFANSYKGPAYPEMAVTTGSLGAFIDTAGFNESSVRPIANAPSQVGTLTKLGGGTLTLSNTNSYTGLTTVSAGTLSLDYGRYAPTQNLTPDTVLPAGNNVSIANGATLQINGRPNAVAFSGTATYNGSGGSQLEIMGIPGNAGYSVSNLAAGESVSGSGIPIGAFITEIYNSGEYMISAPITASGTNVLTYGGVTYNPVVQTLGTLNLISGTGTVDLETNGGSGVSMAMSNAVTGSGNLRLIGNGLLLLSTSNNYSGGTTIAGGTLQIGNAYALGSTTGNLAVNGGTLDLNGYSQTVGALSGSSGGVITTNSNVSITLTTNSASNGTFGGVIQDGSGQLNLTKSGTGTLTLSGANTYTGLTTINGGVLALGNPATLSTGTITFGGGTLQYAASNVDYSAIILNSGSAISIDTTSQAVPFGLSALSSSNIGGLTVMSSSSNGYLQLTNSQHYIGITTIASGGTIKLGDGGSSYDDASLNNSSSIVTNGSLVFLTTGTQTNTVAISGSGTVGMSGPGLQILSGSNSYSGGTKLGGGTLNFDNVNALGNGTVTFTASSTLQAGLAGTFADNMAINPGVTGTFDTQGFADTLSGTISGSGTLAKIGSGTLTLSNSNSYTGGTQINTGILALGNNGALSGSGAISFGGGTLQYTSGVSTDYSGRIASSGSAILIDTNGQNVTFASSLAGSNIGGLTKNGLGTLILNSANGYTGGTIINSGTLQLGNANALNTANALAVNGGTLDMHGNTISVGPLSGNGTIMNNGGVANVALNVSPGASGTATFGGSILQSSSAITLTVVNGTEILTGNSIISTLNAINGGVVIAGGNVSTVNLWVGPGSVTVSSGTLGASFFIQGGNNSSLNLNGGVLLTDWISTFQRSGAFTLAFNGGTVRASGVSGNAGQAAELLANGAGGQPEMTVTTSSNGAFIDTNGYNEYSVRPIADAAGQGPGTLTKLGVGTMTLSNTNSYTGLTTVSAGTLALDYSRYSPTQNATPDSILASGANVSIADGATFSVKGRLNATATSGTAVLAFTGNPGEVITMNTANLTVGESVSGPGIPVGAFITEIYSSGEFMINTPVTSNTTAVLSFSGTTYNAVNQALGSVALTSGTGTINLNVNGGSGVSMTVTNGVTGSGALQETGNGLLILNGSGSYSGGTILAGGTLQLGNTYALGATTGNLAVNGGTVDLNGNSPTIGALTGSSAGTIADSAVSTSSTLTTNSSTSGTFGGIIADGAGQLNLTQAGSGTQTLSNANTYTGATNVNAGTLVVSGSLSASSTTTVATGATLASGNNITSKVGAVTLISDSIGGGTLSPGGSSFGKLTVSGALTLGGSGTVGTAHLAMQIGTTTAGTGYDQVAVSGAVSLNNVNLDLTLSGYTANSHNGGYDSSGNLISLGDTFYLVLGSSSIGGTFANTQAGINNSGNFNTITIASQLFAINYASDGSAFNTTGGNDIALMAIPEPGTWAMLVGGFGILLLTQRMRRRSES